VKLETLMVMFSGMPGAKHTLEISLIDVRKWASETNCLRTALEQIAERDLDWISAFKVEDHHQVVKRDDLNCVVYVRGPAGKIAFKALTIADAIRESEALDSLPSISMEDGLKMRTGKPTPTNENGG
jgi:hypothetical protein